MARGDLQATFEAILGKLNKKKRIHAVGGIESWEACCPAHTDEHPSLLVTRTHKKILFKCRSGGCTYRQIAEALGYGPSDLFQAQDTPLGYTVAKMALDRKLPHSFLTQVCRLKSTEWYDDESKKDYACVSMPYLERDGQKIIFTKERRSLAGKGKQKFGGPPGKTGIYGLWRLDEFLAAGATTLVFVEGESDTWTLWHHNVPTLGVPGADGVDLVTADMVRGFKRVLIWRESDQAGSGFVLKLANRIDRFLMGIEVRTVYHDRHKDPSAMHCADPDGFPAAWVALVDRAVVPTAAPPAPEPGGPGTPLYGQPAGCRLSQWDLPVRHLPYGTLRYEWNQIAARCARLYRDMLRYDEKAGQWFQYDGRRWEPSDGRRTPRDFLYTAIDGLREEADTLGDDGDQDARAAVLDARHRLFRDNTVFRVIEQLVCERSIAAAKGGFDRDPDLINFPNGTFDLKAGFRPHRSDDLITHMMGAPYDPAARCPNFLKFVRQIVKNYDARPGDPDDTEEMFDYFREVAGYTASGYTREHCLFFMYGKGSNGKSVHSRIITAAMGSYACPIKADSIVNAGSERPYYDIADLAGIRMAMCSELAHDRQMNESLIKDMVSDDPMKARFIFERFFKFDPTHKLWMSGNHRPAIRGGDDGLWRRVRLIKMTASFKREAADLKLYDKLVDELPGICAWLIEGAISWYQRGHLVTPERIEKDTQDYRDICDPLTEFLDECCDKHNPYGSEKKIVVFGAYNWWSKVKIMDSRPLGRISFYQQMEDKGYKTVTRTEGRYFQGIALKPEVARQASPDIEI